MSFLTSPLDPPLEGVRQFDCHPVVQKSYSPLKSSHCFRTERITYFSSTAESKLRTANVPRNDQHIKNKAGIGSLSTYSGYGGTSTTSMVSFTVNLSVIWDSPPSATKPSYQNITTTTASYPLARGSLTGCFEMFENNFGAISCYQAASLFGVNVVNWVRWNPSVLNGQNYTMTGCKLTNETEYCGSFYNQSGEQMCSRAHAEYCCQRKLALKSTIQLFPPAPCHTYPLRLIRPSMLQPSAMTGMTLKMVSETVIQRNRYMSNPD